MDYLIAPLVLQGLEAAAQQGDADAMAACAWHFRQRDSREALAWCDRPPVADAPRWQARLALVRCEVAALDSRLDEAEDWLVQARRAPLSEPSLAGDALLAEALVAKARGQRERELDAYERAGVAFERSQQADRAGLVQAWLGYERAFGEPKLALPAAALPPAEAFVLAARALPLSRRDPAAAAEAFLRAADIARHWGLRRHALICTVNAGTALQGLGDFDRAAACYDQAALEARAAGWPAVIGACETRLGALLKEIGRLEDALQMLSDALASLAPVPPGINKANACAELAQTLLALQRGLEAVGPMSEAIAMYRAMRSTDNLSVNLLGLARALSAAGQVEAALAALEEAQALIAEHDFSALVMGVHEVLAEMHRRHDLPAPEGLCLPNAALHHGEALLAEGSKLPGWKPPSSLFIALAEDWAAAGDMARAYGRAREALAAKDREAERMRLNQPLASLRPRPVRTDGGPSPAGARLLSPKERAVVSLLARNYSNKEIATALEVSDETIKSHLKKIFAKLEAGSRKHAVTRARALGVIGVVD